MSRMSRSPPSPDSLTASRRPWPRSDLESRSTRGSPHPADERVLAERSPMQGDPNVRLQQLQHAGVSIWLDTLSRELLDSGEFSELVRQYAVTGATSTPTIFAKAITGSDRYDEQLRELTAAGERNPQELFFQLALDDVRGAARELRAVYDASGGRDGFVSFECTPDLADNADA